MNEFERKPDGGLNNWIETYEAMGGGENDAEMLCLLLELRRRRENQTKAERESDELKASLIAASNMQSIHREACQKAEAELARRDAAAGEPDGYIFCHPSGKNFWSVSHDDTAGHNGVKPFYFAAPPAVLPPEWEGTEHNEYAVGKQDGWNECLEEALKLGAQPQKPVVLPAMFNLKMAGDVKTKQYFKGSNDTIKQIAGLLDAANVKWEVKK